GYFAAYRVIIQFALMPINLVALGCLERSSTVFRWLPAGEGRDGLRHRILGPATGRGVSLKPSAAIHTFEVNSAKADAAISAEISRTFQAEGLAEATEPDVSLVVVTNMADWKWVANQLRSPRAIAILASSVRLPEESKELRKHQWMDYRN